MYYLSSKPHSYSGRGKGGRQKKKPVLDEVKYSTTLRAHVTLIQWYMFRYYVRVTEIANTIGVFII